MPVIRGKKVDFVCINVAGSTERRAHMERNMDDFGIPLRFFNAITPDTRAQVENDYSEARTRRWCRRPLAPTEQACALSHIQVWREFLRSDNDYLMVFEDDVRFQPEFMEVVQAVLALPAVPDFIKFSGMREPPCVQKQSLNIGKYALFLNAYGPLDATCYLLTKASAERLERYCVKMFLPIDIMMDRTYEHGVACYSVRPYPARQITEAEEGGLTSAIGMKVRALTYDHNKIHLKLAFRALRACTSVRKHWAVVRLKIGR